MSSDLVKRLRDENAIGETGPIFSTERLDITLREAADRIEALEGERDKLKWSMEKYEDRAEAADARAERLRVALDYCNRLWPNETARKALEDDKQ